MRAPLRITLATLSGVIGTASVAVICSLTAGRWDVPMFWVAAGVTGLIALVSGLLIDPGLFWERFRPGPGGKDKILIPAAKILVLAGLCIAGLDVGRRHWSDTVPLAVQILGLTGYSLGMGLMVWGMVVNRFFSTVVRLQHERGHHVITAGPYSIIRHPGYAGGVVGMPCLGIALGSWLSALPLLVFSLLLLRRTHLEDRFLRENLEGYAEYAQCVRFRFLPGVW